MQRLWSSSYSKHCIKTQPTTKAVHANHLVPIEQFKAKVVALLHSQESKLWHRHPRHRNTSSWSLISWATYGPESTGLKEPVGSLGVVGGGFYSQYSWIATRSVEYLTTGVGVISKKKHSVLTLLVRGTTWATRVFKNNSASNWRHIPNFRWITSCWGYGWPAMAKKLAEKWVPVCLMRGPDAF